MTPAPQNGRQIALNADFTELPRLAAWTEAALAELRPDDRTAYALQLCIEELVANVVLHGRRAAGPITITLRLEMAPLRLTIEDDAQGFDPTATTMPDAETVGGRGLLLVRRFCREWRYARRDGRNVLELVFSEGRGACPSSTPAGN